MALPVQDTFTEASDTALESHSPETSHSWSGAETTAWDVTASTDVAQRDGTNNQLAALAVGGSDADYLVEGTFATGGSGGDDRFGLYGRYNGASFGSQSGYFGGKGTGADGSWALSRLDAGSFNTLGSGSISGFSASTEYKFGVHMNGNQISLYIDDVEEVAPVTDSTYSAVGSIGMFGRGTNMWCTLIEAESLAAGGGTILPHMMHLH